VLHHMKNNGLIAHSDLVLLDVAAESAFYAADISRTVPAAGRFTSRQRAVYDAVLRTQTAAIALLKPGVNKREYEDQVGQLILDELVKLNVIKPTAAKAPDATKLLRAYYPHGTSHFLGLDVHDVGDYTVPLEPGMVLTVEPGIYLREEGIGIRIEDDILITDTGCEVLSKDIPADPDEIEALIQKGQNQ
jgi:Xaa-Pro aminopeptidase